MAVAGLHNVSVLDSSFLRESQSPVSGRWGSCDRSSNRASSLLQMWRELESEHMVSCPQVRFGESPSHPRSEGSNADSLSMYMSEGTRSENGDNLGDANEAASECNACSQYHIQSQNEHEAGNSSGSEHSSDFGEVERERVRQIFQEWMNSCGGRNVHNVSHMKNHSRAQWLGENECERVRIIREWVQRTTQQRGTNGSCREEQAAEIGIQIEQVRDGLAVNHCEIGARRAIRRLCGRQTLLDLLTRAERERKRELQALLEHRPVSHFAHRNRIQSLLRGRFLRNDRVIQDARPPSMAASELGLLRERHTVSDLREGFLSRMDHGFLGPVTSAQSDASTNDESIRPRDEQSEADNSQKPLDGSHDQSEPANGEREMNGFHASYLENDTSGLVNQQESNAQMEETQRLQSEEREQQQFFHVECIGIRVGCENVLIGNLQVNNACESSGRTLGIEGISLGHLSDDHDEFQENSESIGEQSDIPGVSSHTDSLEGDTLEDFNWQDASVQAEEWHESSLENEESDWQQLASVEFSEWIDSSAEGEGGDWQESTANQWHPDSSGNDDQSQLQESHEEWHENGLQEALDNWLVGPSGEGAAPVRRANSFLFPDDDNVQNMELRELSSRRRVSNLLQSGFRESLDRLMQSYVERQAHASLDWDPDRASTSPTLVEQDEDLESGYQNVGQLNAVERMPYVFPSPPVTSSQPLWEQQLHDADWPVHSIHQQLGIEWEIINDLRIDMVRLQQRMNNMQRMLEACMEMQLELQRSVRQEVSAALNMSAGLADACEDSLPNDESKWDYVRKGICCICSDSSIDSLLYRCGHMCTCSKCAEKLVKGKGKCPMCKAPVVEVIRAYAI